MLNHRFWSKVTVKTQSDCWEWHANRNNKGYGLFRPGGSAPKKLAHRLSYEHAYGKIPDGMHILNSCANPACVNPAHHSAGTLRDNMTDAAQKGRAAGMKLADASVIDLLKDNVAGMSHAGIAAKYRLSVKSVPDYV